MISKFLPQSFNDFLALVLIGVIVTLWILQGKETIALSEGVNGALIVIFTLVAQFYFRKKQEEK